MSLYTIDLEKIANDKAYKIYEDKSVEECLVDCLNDGNVPLNVLDIRALRNNGTISKNKWYDTSTIQIDGVQRDATLDELKNIKDFYKKGGRVLFVDDRGGDGVINGSGSLSNVGRFVGVPLSGEAATKNIEQYRNIIRMLKTEEGQKYLNDNPKDAREIYTIISPALMKSK